MSVRMMGMLVLLCAGFAPALAQDDSAALERVAELGRGQGALSMPFAHRRYSTLFKTPQMRRGVFYYDGGERAALQYMEPEPYVFLIREGEALHLRSDQPEAQRLDLRRAPLMAGLAQMFQLDPTRLKKAFKVMAREEAAEERLVVELEPLRSAPVTRVILHVDTSTGLLRQLRLDETSGDSQVIQFGDPLDVPPLETQFLPDYWMKFFKETTAP
ncbi:MAG: outer membrane lipoprotein carrier protein LolA [Kiritimatiellae bacterium]|nr:outer membrane lipoprotein carrier protein LolA [Kiritimatiellia bacterium]